MIRIRSHTPLLLALTLLAAVGVGILYEAPHLLIKKNLLARGVPYLPLTLEADEDESRIYAPEIEEASHGRFYYGDPALKEHNRDPIILAPLGPFVLGQLVRAFGMESFWFWSDAIFPPLLFLLFLAIAYQITRNAGVSFLASGMLIFFRQAASYFPPSTLPQLKTLLAQFIPYVREGHYTTHLAFGRFLTPEWTYIPLSLCFFFLVCALAKKQWFSASLAGILYGLLFYSYPFDAIAVSLIIGIYCGLALLARDARALRIGGMVLAVGIAVSIPYWINLWQLSHLPQYHEILNRTGIEVGRHVRWSLLPHYAVWLPLGWWLWRVRARSSLALLGSAVFLGALLTMNIQIITGYVPTPKLFLSYSLALPLWIAYLIAGKIALSRPLARQRKTALWIVGIAAVGLVLVKNLQVPFGYAREQSDRFALQSDVHDSLSWIRAHLPADAVLLSPSFATVTHLLIYTPVKTYLSSTGTITSASNAELVQRFYIAMKLFGMGDEAIAKRFGEEGIAAILANDQYVKDFDKSQSTSEFRNFDDMWTHLREAQNAWRASPETLIAKYAFDYVYAGPDEKKEFAFSETKFPGCLSPIYTRGEVTIFKRCAP